MQRPTRHFSKPWSRFSSRRRSRGTPSYDNPLGMRPRVDHRVKQSVVFRDIVHARRSRWTSGFFWKKTTINILKLTRYVFPIDGISILINIFTIKSRCRVVVVCVRVCVSKPWIRLRARWLQTCRCCEVWRRVRSRSSTTTDPQIRQTHCFEYLCNKKKIRIHRSMKNKTMHELVGAWLSRQWPWALCACVCMRVRVRVWWLACFCLWSVLFTRSRFVGR